MKTEIRVSYEETDRMGVVYYAKYFIWFERARTEFFRKLGIPYRDLEEKNGLRLMVVDAKCTYKFPATYDDLLTIETNITAVKNTSLIFAYKVYRVSMLLATGQTSHVFTDKNGKPLKIPRDIRRVLLSSQSEHEFVVG